MEDKDTCPICFDIFEHPKILTCRHTFCFKCLKDYAEDISSERGLFCPLCRTQWKVPKGGIRNLPTNFFVSSKLQTDTTYCRNCHKTKKILDTCQKCGSNFCLKCFQSHFHTKNTEESESESSDDEFISDNTRESAGSLIQKVRTRYTCRQDTQFVVDMQPDKNNFRRILSICSAKSGGILALLEGVPFIIKYNENGKIEDKIHTPYQCSGIIELQDGVSMMGAFVNEKVILKYKRGQWYKFSSCTEFHPSDIVELSNGNILSCGSDHLFTKSEIHVKRTGYLQVYSAKGKPLYKLDEIAGCSKMLAFPHNLAYNKENGTIAVADLVHNSVVLLKENGKSYSIYHGNVSIKIPLPFSDILTQKQFTITGVTRGRGRYFIIATEESNLHLIDESGSLKALARINNAESSPRVMRIPRVVQDFSGTFWCSESFNGTISTFKIVRYKNNLNRSRNIRRSERGSSRSDNVTLRSECIRIHSAGDSIGYVMRTIHVV